MSLIQTLLHVRVKDAQGYEETLTFGITAAAFGATTLPTEAHVINLVNSIFSDEGGLAPSDAIVLYYGVEVRQIQPAAIGGLGGSGTNIAARVRSNLNTADEFSFRIPGLNKSRVTFGFSDPNQIITTSGIWDNIRTAGAVADLHIHSEKPGLAFVAAGDLAQEATLFTGRRSPRQPR